MDGTGLLATAERTLERHWGYAHLRYQQRRVVLAGLSGRDCLALLPTGGGKSICFQLPAIVRGGLTLVVSPLISLMQDQVGALTAKGVSAAYLSSTLNQETRRAVRERTLAGQVTLLYVAPERLPSMVRETRLTCGLLAVDEAHCISEWGHEFRPHYRDIGKHRRLLGTPPTLAVTATATPATRADIVRVLGLRNPVRVVASFDRPNLHFAVERCADERERLYRALALIKAVAGTVIVYVPTRNRADGVAAWLRRKGLAAAPYHGDLPGPERRTLLTQFLDGSVRVMAATNAFGMGIDKPDVRLVLHTGIPARPESYYQEAGRAGRGGAPCRCVLLGTKRDLVLTASLSGGPGAKSGLETMHRYVRTRRCRRRVLLQYLGEDAVRCSGCDRCGGGRIRD
jgi:ATP-dependent DNA helicase RecQ